MVVMLLIMLVLFRFFWLTLGYSLTSFQFFNLNLLAVSAAICGNKGMSG